VGGDLVKSYDTVKRGNETLYVVSATDCIRDRLSAFYFWNNRSSLETALDVALAVPDKIDLDLIEGWSARERETNKFVEFERQFRSRRAALG